MNPANERIKVGSSVLLDEFLYTVLLATAYRVNFSHCFLVLFLVGEGACI